jgi:hypothetical protein
VAALASRQASVWKGLTLENHDVYLILLQTNMGKRYWRVSRDYGLDSDEYAWFGPATLGPDGYESERDAADAIASLEDFDLQDPKTWPRHHTFNDVSE